MTDDPQIARAEQERRRREAEWLILMLLLVGDTRRDAVRAATVGRDVLTIARSTFLGHAATSHEGAAPIVAEQMAQAEIEGMRRAYRMAGLTPPKVDAATFDRIAASHAQEAREYAERTWSVIEQKLAPALQGSVGQGIGETTKAIRIAFKEAGVTKADPSTLEKGIERQVVEKHNAGMIEGAYAADAVGNDPAHHLVGFEFVAVLDKATTQICRARNGIRLPPDSEFWQTSTPPCHWGCRSVLKSLWGERLTDESTVLPTVPVTPGFGHPPSRDLGSYFGLTKR